MKDELQVENGNFTRIVNPLLENLIKVPFKGCELSVAIFIIRKTYGFGKTQDELSISQIMKGVGRSRQTVVTALKNLQLVNVARLVKQGNAKGDCNIWTINKYYNTWKLVKTARLVKRNDKPSLTERLNLVKTARHTKDTTKETKDNSDIKSQDDNEPFELHKYIRKLEDNPRREMNIIALYLDERKPNILNIDQMRSTVKRHLRPAKELTAFTNNQILNAIPKAKELNSGWTLETLIKILTK